MLTPDTLIRGRYRVEHQIGQGAMGTVYRVYDRLTDQTIALKQVTVPRQQLQFASRSAFSDLRVALVQEFKTLASLRHPNIISVLGYGLIEEGQPFFTMELLTDVEDLTTFGRALAFPTQIDLLIQLLEALNYLHRREILHRDLKPANTAVVHGQVKLLDFGLAVAQGASDEDPNLVAGTIAYLPPEILDGAPASVASDLYAVGMIAYQLFAGEHPFNLGSINLLMLDIFNTIPDVAALPISAAMQDVIATLLAKDPADRYPSTTAALDAIAAATAQPRTVESATIRESYLQAATFVGREREFEHLRVLLAEAVDGRGSICLIGGESGVGKSRLLDEMRTHALVEGMLVLRGQATAEGGAPYQLWRWPLRRLILLIHLSDLEAGVLKALIPDIAELIERDVADVPELPGPANARRLAQIVTDVFQRACDIHPILLLLEDLHWAAESVAVLNMLCRSIENQPLLIIGSYRDDETHDLREELPQANYLKLNRLKDKAIVALSASMLGEAGRQPAVIDLIKRETEGNTFFMVEVVRALAEDAGQLAQVGSAPLPETVFAGGVQEIVLRRLGRVPSWGQILLRYAAVAGRQLDDSLLNYLVESHRSALLPTDGTFDDWLVACANAAVLEVYDDYWRFSHDKLRETLIHDLDGEEKRTLSHEIAEAIEAVYPQDENYAMQLLEHWHIAGELDNELRYLDPAARRLIAIEGRYARAEHLINRTLSQLGDDDERQIRFLPTLGLTHIRRGDYTPAKEVLHHARQLAEQHNDLRGLAASLNLLGAIAYNEGHYSEAQVIFEQIIPIWRELDEQPGLAGTLNNLGLLTNRGGAYAQAHAYHAESLTIRRALGDQDGVAACLNNLGVVATYQGDYAAARAYHEESMAIARELDDRMSVAMSLDNQGWVDLLDGAYADSRLNLEAALAIRRDLEAQSGIAGTLTNLGVLSYRERDYETAEMHLREGLAIRRRIGDQWQPYVMQWLARTLLRLDQADAARRYLHEAAQQVRNLATPMKLNLLVTAAEHYLVLGAWETAAHLTGLIQAHPAVGAEARQDAASLREILHTQADIAALETALAVGSAGTPDAALDDLLRDLG